MDDPWANAWGDPAKPPLSSPHDAEADIALPSWSTGSAVSWEQPSKDQSTLWISSEPVGTGWSSTYDDIPLGKASSDSLHVQHSPPSPQANDEVPMPSSPEPDTPEPTSEPVQDPEIRSTITPPPASPDAFGTFETGLKANEPNLDPWAAGSVVSPADTASEDVWVASWGAPDHDAKGQSPGEPVDEWEKAKRQKARQDEHVPPERLASILDSFKLLSSDLWPAKSSAEEQVGARSGLESVEGLDSISKRLIPRDLTLPSSVQFSKTFTAKHMGDSVRLSRHVPITRLSPFTLYMASKGSTAWEVSVKSRVEVASDDLLPPGWRVVEKEKEEHVPAIEMKKKGSGGLLSFFGRKSTYPAVEANPLPSESPGPVLSISTTIPSSNVPSPVTQSTRPSLDKAKSPTRSSTPVLSGATSGTVADSTPAIAISVPSSQTTALDIPDKGPPAPSAVSRFLGRFSRSKSSGSGVKESLALSTDDLEFLSDIVPSAKDDIEENDQLTGLSDMLSSSPLSTPLPPLLAAPPRAPPTNLINENLTSQLSKPAVIPDKDPFSIFDSPPTMSKPSTQSIAPSLLPPQLYTTSILPLRPPTSSLQRSESQGTPSSSQFSGRSSSPLESSASVSRSQTPSGKRAPIAIMSTGSYNTNSRSIATLPPPPILPPPPPIKSTGTPSHSRASSQHNILGDDDDFASFSSPPVSQPSLLSDASTSSVFSDQSLFLNTSSHHTKLNSDFFDDFDDFVSSPIHDPSPPQPPAKPSFLGQPLSPPPEVPAQPSQLPPPTKHPSPPARKSSRAADHQRTLSLVKVAASRTGRWPAPPSPLPSPLPPPEGFQISDATGPSSSMQVQQKNAYSGAMASLTSSSGFPFPPPPGFSGLQTSTMSPSPPPQSRTVSPAQMVNLVMKNGLEASSVSVDPPKYTPSATPTVGGGLSAQDLSFFEGL